ncbi:MAG: NADH:ubiquinone reductase (Na(+)-transporting) subunit B [Simkaniaceae bacterium]
MIRKLLDKCINATKPGNRLEKWRPLVQALDTFMYEPDCVTESGPHIRDSVDQKRWMILVVIALLPCTLMAIWNTGVQSYVFGDKNLDLMQSYITASSSFKSYMNFCLQWVHLKPILSQGLATFLPVLFISYLAGGIVEALFAFFRGHEISEGFLVSGILFALILPSTIPYWLVAVGVASGIILSKELFGGSGMNILNPALTCRCLLYFAYPTKMVGDVFIGSNPSKIKKSLLVMNEAMGPVDGISQSSALGIFNISSDIKKIHIDTLLHFFQTKVSTLSLIKQKFAIWSEKIALNLPFQELSLNEVKAFLTAEIEQGGLGLSPDNYSAAFKFAQLKMGTGLFSNGNFIFGNQVGSFGETSIIACLFGLIFLLFIKIASWRTMVAMALGGFLCALLFNLGGNYFGIANGAWNPAKFDFPAYKHLIIGSFAFGLVFMITDPVSSPDMNLSKWFYGFMVGALTIIIRVINPAYPEGVMLAILFGNVFAPLFDRYSLKRLRIKRLKDARKIHI